MGRAGVQLVAVAAAAAAAPSLGQAVSGKTRVNDRDFLHSINEVNKARNYSWTAGVNPFFHGFSFDDARALLGTSLSHISEHLEEVLPESAYAGLADSEIPAEFDARTKWPGLIHPIRDQQRCGSCWAVSASEVLSDRVAIATGKPSPVLSPEDMVSCDGGDHGCQGGQLGSAWSYLQNTGIVSESCFPYTAGAGTAATCSKQCADSETWSQSKVKAKSSYAINGAVNMQKDIMTNGPIQVAFMVYKSFMSYKSGVYEKHPYEILPEGGHAVKVVGWGSESGVDYWLVANSWNTNWGLDGFFKIKRGSDACGIESRGPPYAGLPAVSATDELVV
jgi:cathepsin B